MGVSQNLGYHFGGPHNKDYSILESMLGSPYVGKIPYTSLQNDRDDLGLRHFLIPGSAFSQHQFWDPKP